MPAPSAPPGKSANVPAVAPTWIPAPRFPELRAMEDIRSALSQNALPPLDTRTPVEHARIICWRTFEEVLRLLETYGRRVHRGERCRLVEREHPPENGRLLLEFVIEDTRSGAVTTPAPPMSAPASSTAPAPTAPASVARTPIPTPQFCELWAMRELRRALSQGPVPPLERRSPEIHARLACFRIVKDLLSLLDAYGRRVERGERCRLVEREHPRENGRLLLEFMFEVLP